tara:strand:+ start:3804 stop:4211 length:408 start_codon:yes stop_codon:yes gene_type:complete
MNHTFDLEHGGFDTVGENGAPYILPKMISVTITFKPIHEHPIGWTSDDNLWIGTSDQHKVYEPDQGPRDLDINESELPTFPFGIGPTMLNIESPVVEPIAVGADAPPVDDGVTTLPQGESPTNPANRDPFSKIEP